MIRGKTIALILGPALLLTACAAHQKETAAPAAPEKSAAELAPPPVESVLEPKAIEILKAASQRLASARSMMFTAIVSYESPSIFGPPLIYTTKSEVTLQRPDKLRVVTPGDGPASEFYYDGKAMIAFEPDENLAAIADAPPTIDAALQEAFNLAAIYFPFTDVIVDDPYADMSDGMTQAFYIGQSNLVGGTTTDIVAFINGVVFEQVWIGAKDKLPRMARAVFVDDPSGLRQQIEFKDWRLNSKTAANAFTSPRAKSARRIRFERPDFKAAPAAGSPAAPSSGTK